MLEIEKRCLLSVASLKSLRHFLKARSFKHREEFRFSLVNVPDNSFKQNTDALVDLKLRTNGIQGRLTAKTGSWHSATARPEHEVFFEHSEFSTYLEILRCLGKTFWIAMYTRRNTYQSAPITWTINEHYFTGDIVAEVEIVGTENNMEASIAAIDDALSPHDMTSLTTEQTISLIERINSEPRSHVDLIHNTVDTFLMNHKTCLDCTLRWES